MKEETLKYIRTHKELYDLLREDSSLYEEIYKNNDYVYELQKLAKEKYGTRFIDKIDNLSNKLNLLSSFLDIFK
ncbi:MAG: hypothetical protein IKQ06_05240 [Bacilli bacterium]|nr:hypothetical protein [Bacilli bacterium]MBR6137542.1 hypothetical protein [Bacilli bacterium]